ncbi:uncharacterized protein LOC129761453 [Toxorhynchites rutilus septentrionalis]|uniref:uncharacterized protein LOC129761453 n=1 Tax=Toxorhynchites rutilus septentrionalis TaxID=329112 RepID=UPI00247B1EE8|nr:uncharacterized protein LOC129761453 [Toxorhynchites rutilus septentrionalis]
MPLEHSPNKKQQNADEQHNDDEQQSGLFRGFPDNENNVGATSLAYSKELAAVFRQRNQIKLKIVRIQKSLQGEQNVGLAQLNVFSKNLSAAYTEFSGFHSKVMELISDDELAAQEKIYEDFENLYNFVSMIVEDLILTAKDENSISMNKPQVIIQQQPLKAQIPTFDGSYSAWPKFKAIFQDLMAMSGDSDVIKLFHLDKALIGSAVGALDAKIMSEGNYDQAWAVLTERYENQRVIVESHIRGLFSLPKMSTESCKDLRTLLDEATRHVESLRYLQQHLTGVSEHMVVYLIVNALDRSTRKAWESSLRKAELPKYEPTIAFLKSRCQILENCENATQPSGLQPKSKTVPVTAKLPTTRSHAAVTKPAEINTIVNACAFCGGQHMNFQCNKLNDLSAAQKNEKVRALGICFNCLRKGHRSRDCPSSKTCRKCQKRHHTQLHDDTEAVNRDLNLNAAISREHQPPVAAPKPVTREVPISTTCSCNCTQDMKTVLLLTAVVHVFDRNNHPHLCRVLLDSGSQVNFITEQMADRLAIPKKSANISITGINALRTLARDKVTVHFRSRNSEYRNQIECLITPKVTGTIPTSKIDITHWKIPNGFALADPEFHLPAKVDLLVGAELFFELMKPGQLNLAENLPQLRETCLGWIVAGVVDNSSSGTLQHSNLASIDDIESRMHRFWEIEDVPNVSQYSTEQRSCEEHFVNTCKRDDSGRFVVKLPLKENSSDLDDCYALALKRFLSLEKRLARDSNLRSQYQDFIREYEDLGHCQEVTPTNETPNQSKYYMPHHAVLRPTSSSTKCRVVFDASAKSSPTALSLNDVLMVGPVVQSDLYSIVLRFRKYRYVFSADITKMYRQILVAPEDRTYQRILWRESPSDPLRVLQLNTVTYGTASASFQASRCLMKLAEDEAAETPSAARVQQEDFYMDDALSGADTIDDAVDIQQQLQKLLSKGGFTIHKWCSNSEEFLSNIPEECREKQMPIPEYGANEAIKLLGLLWDPRNDIFFITNPFRQQATNDNVTKRGIYSEISKLFDPIGIIAPVIVAAKLLVQQLWKAKLDWDEPVNIECLHQWKELKTELPLLTHINVPRCVTFDNVVSFSLHGFADASSVAYGACIYLRNEFADGSAKLRLLSSKSKVAPLHELSIPRKELCAALLLTRLLQRVIPALKMEVREIVL